MRRGVPGEAEVLLALADELVDDSGRNAVRAEATDGEVLAVAHEIAYGVRDGRDLVAQCPRLACERLAQFGGRRVGKQLPAAGRGSHWCFQDLLPILELAQQLLETG